MRTIEIIKGLNQKELLKWEAETGSILDELNWKLIKAERTLYLHQTALQECREKLETHRKRAEETRMALQFLSEGHPLRDKCEDDLYRTEIRIFRLENRLKKFSLVKPIQLEMKKIIVSEEIKYYEGILKSIENMLWSTLVLSRVMEAPDGETARNAVSDKENIFILPLKQEAVDIGNFFYPSNLQLKQEAIDVRNLFLSVG